jgi:hypothetical protein
MEYKTFASEIGLTEKFTSNQHEVHFDQTSENFAQILLEIITRYSMQDSPVDKKIHLALDRVKY